MPILVIESFRLAEDGVGLVPMREEVSFPVGITYEIAVQSIILAHNMTMAIQRESEIEAELPTPEAARIAAKRALREFH